MISNFVSVPNATEIMSIARIICLRTNISKNKNVVRPQSGDRRNNEENKDYLYNGIKNDGQDHSQRTDRRRNERGTFQFSHGSYEEHAERIALVRQVSEQLGIPVALMLDTKGPEIRTGLLKDGKKVSLEQGKEFTLYTEEREGDETGCSITYQRLVYDVRKGDTILIDDGLIGLEVQRVSADKIECIIKNGGELGERKGVNVPNVKIHLPGVTQKDREDILFGIEQGVDYIAASFVRNSDCIMDIREILEDNHGRDIGIIAKIENAEGVENIDEILDAADGIMVARGDLGVEIPADQVPHIQKKIIHKCNRKCKPVVTATQMLDSMIRNPRPTRAEAGDVANAIYDGSDAIMLSGETAMGKYPVEAVRMMAKIAETTEAHLDYSNLQKLNKKQRKKIFPWQLVCKCVHS